MRCTNQNQENISNGRKGYLKTLNFIDPLITFVFKKHLHYTIGQPIFVFNFQFSHIFTKFDLISRNHFFFFFSFFILKKWIVLILYPRKLISTSIISKISNFSYKKRNSFHLRIIIQSIFINEIQK